LAKVAAGKRPRARGISQRSNGAAKTMALHAAALEHVRLALTANDDVEDAEKRQKAHELEALRAFNDGNDAKYRLLTSIGLAEAARQTQYLESDRTLPNCKSMPKFFKHAARAVYLGRAELGHLAPLLKDHTVESLATITAEELDDLGLGEEDARRLLELIRDRPPNKLMKLSTYQNNAAKFWRLLAHHCPLVHDGVSIERDQFQRKNWADPRSKSACADESTLTLILRPGFAKAFVEELRKTGKTVSDLNKEAMDKEKGKATTDAPAKAPAKQPRRRSKKAAPAPAETTEAAETTPPKAKAPARRARRQGRRREDDDDEDDFAPPPKVKADDEIKTAVGEAAPTTLDLLVDNNKMLRRDLAARDEELAAARAEIAAYKEQIKEKEAESRIYVNIARDAQEELDAVKDELARVKNEHDREKDKNKTLSAAVCPRISPLCDATNA
jgi:hypothetical protein